MGKRKQQKQQRRRRSLSPGSSSSDVETIVNIVTPERQLVRYLENKRMNSGYSSNSDAENFGSRRRISRALFAEPSRSRGDWQSIDSQPTWGGPVSRLLALSVWWNAERLSENGQLDFLSFMTDRIERFTKWSHWTTGESPLVILSDYVRVIMRSLSRNDLAGLTRLFENPPDKELLSRSLTTPFGDYGRTILHAFAVNPQIDSLIDILRHVQTTRDWAKDRFGLTPLHLLVLNAHWQDSATLQKFIQFEPGKNSLRVPECSGGCLPFHLFLLADHTVMPPEQHKRCLLQLRGVSSEVFSELRSPVLVAVSNPIEAMVLRSLEFFAHAGGSDINGYSALHIACSLGMPNAVSVLIDLIPKNFRMKKCKLQQSSPMHVAAAGGSQLHAECISVLIEKLSASEILYSLKDGENWPPLLYALFSGQLATVRACVRADEMLVDSTWGSCPQLQYCLHLIKGLGKKRIEKLLHSFVTIPEFFDFLNLFIARDVSRLTGSLGFMLELPMGARLLSLDNKVRFLQHRSFSQTKCNGVGVSFKIFLPRPDGDDRIQWLARVGTQLQEGHYQLGQRLEVRFLESSSFTSIEAGYGIGVSREFFSIVSSIITTELFLPNPTGHSVLPNDSELMAHKTAGMLTALSLISETRMNLDRVSKLLWDFVTEGDIGYVPDVDTLEDWDPELARSFRFVLSANSDSDSINDLLGGENKYQYVAREIRSRIFTEGMKEFRFGFYSVLSEDWVVDFFRPRELAVVVGSDGNSALDTKDWKDNTNYANGYTAESEQVKWFWALINSLSDDEKRLALLFATGLSAAPFGGFANLKTLGGDLLAFSIMRLPIQYGDDGPLPTAATCLNLFRLPEYPTRDILNEKVLIAIRLGSQGFAFA